MRRTSVVDIATLLAFCAVSGLLISNFLGLAPEYFAADHGVFIAPAFFAVLAFIYVQCQDRKRQVTAGSAFALLFRFLLLFFVYATAGTAFFYWRYPQDRGEWTVGAF